MTYYGATRPAWLGAPSLHSLAALSVGDCCASNEPWEIKAGDTLPLLIRQLLDGEGAPINLTGATVTIDITDARFGKVVTAGVVTIIDGVGGWVRYAPPAGWSSGRLGTYYAEFNVTDQDGEKLTVPTRKSLKVKIHKNLG